MIEALASSVRFLPLLIPLTLIFFMANLAHFSATNRDENALLPLALLAFIYVFMPLAVFLAG